MKTNRFFLNNGDGKINKLKKQKQKRSQSHLATLETKGRKDGSYIFFFLLLHPPEITSSSTIKKE